MADLDLIMDGSHTPAYSEITDYIEGHSKALWQDMNEFIQQKYNAAPKITYSKCSAKPGWNVKYQKSGKSLCTLYPEKDCFVALIVVTLELLPFIEGMSSELDTSVIKTIMSAKPFNGTLWLMIKVDRQGILDSVRKLLLLKHSYKASIK